MSDHKFLQKEKEKKPANKLMVCAVALSIILVALLVGLLILVLGGKQTELLQETYPAIFTAEESEFEDIALETPYCALFYSGKWQEYIRTEVVSDGVECVASFYGSAGDKEVLLFSVLFAVETENSFSVGVLEAADGSCVDVCAEIADLDFGKDWKQLDVDMICAMQEQLNFVLDKLRETPGFME